MLFSLIPGAIMSALKNLDISKVYELRLRRNAPIVVNYDGKYMILKTNGSTGEEVVCDKIMIESVMKAATENSLYAYNYQIKQGFITARGGIRLGISGESVTSDNFMPKTIKDIYSINIRVPHEKKNCGAVAFKFMFNKETGIKNTLIVSPPGAGKTTFLRDIARQISEQTDKIYNVLIVDERFEIASVVQGEPMLDCGKFSDIVSGADKQFCFTNGIRAMRPDVIITDELISEEDMNAVIFAAASGVKVIASVHASSLTELKEKPSFSKVLGEKVFERYVVISNKNGPGTYQGIYDQNLNCIYF